jgi:flavin reductase (DIM6/NTAB) family NADH-FMN oxidoreductase RutF
MAVEDESLRQGIGRAMGRIPMGIFVLTARYEDRRTGMIASWVQQVAFQPPMVSVAIGKGRSILPLISESRHFGLCQLDVSDRIIYRKFTQSWETHDDPFLGFELRGPSRTGVPVLAHCLSYLECEVTCHIDVEGDHDLFVGTVRAGTTLSDRAPMVLLRQDGFTYEDPL